VWKRWGDRKRTATVSKVGVKSPYCPRVSLEGEKNQRRSEVYIVVFGGHRVHVEGSEFIP